MQNIPPDLVPGHREAVVEAVLCPGPGGGVELLKARSEVLHPPLGDPELGQDGDVGVGGRLGQAPQYNVVAIQLSTGYFGLELLGHLELNLVDLLLGAGDDNVHPITRVTAANLLHVGKEVLCIFVALSAHELVPVGSKAIVDTLIGCFGSFIKLFSDVLLPWRKTASEGHVGILRHGRTESS